MTDEMTIRKVAEIARLDLSESEIKKFSADLKDIVHAFKELEKVKTDGVEPAFQPMELTDVLREDKLENCLDQKIALSNVDKNKEGGYFKGPKAV